MKKVFLITIILIISFSAKPLITKAQTQENFEKFCNWMAGTWHGDAFGGTSEEVWSPLQQGEMVGTFRHFSKGKKTTFYEFFRMNTQALQLKHFSPDFKGWESKEKYVEFPFVKATANSLEFEGIHYIKKDANTLEVILKMKQKDKIVTEKLIFYRGKKQ